MRKSIFILSLVFISALSTNAQHSIARTWNEALLEAIRNDFARPTVHARNLFHHSAAMYDAWAIYNQQASTYLLGKNLQNVLCPIENENQFIYSESAVNETISYASFRLLLHRFQNSPNEVITENIFYDLMDSLNYDIFYESTEYQNGNPAALGNYIAKCYIEYGFADRSNEQNQYENIYYKNVNEALQPEQAGNPDIEDPNRYQTLKLGVFIDQSGNEIVGEEPQALSPEWGFVKPFALTENELSIENRDGNDYWIYHNPGDPPFLNSSESDAQLYKKGFEMVAVWSSHLSPSDETLVDISPGAIGNSEALPTNFEDYDLYYNYFEGGDYSIGYDLNPATGNPYESNMVKRGNFSRVLAEFWADGPDSETPPGHWFTILNYVSDHPLLEKKFEGANEVLSDLEWDLKSYFTLGGAMHDAAISAWSVKGYHDYIRPISAIRYLADQGQCTDENLPNFNTNGINLVDGFIELVTANDPLVGENQENINKIKLYAWQGPDSISNVVIDEAEVGWILAENWWPYQRPTFVTPPFPGFVSGHSTFSRAAAEVLTAFTGSAFFPGGLGEFEIKAYNFLVFERGPTETFNLQWATYKDAADQSALSRIWGGIHPPCDDIPGREIGIKVGNAAFDLAKKYFEGTAEDDIYEPFENNFFVYPNPTRNAITVLQNYETELFEFEIIIYDLLGRAHFNSTATNATNATTINLSEFTAGTYTINISSENFNHSEKLIIFD